MSEKRKLPDWFIVLLVISCVAWVVLLICTVPAFADDFTPDDVTYPEHETLNIADGAEVGNGNAFFTADDVAQLLTASLPDGTSDAVYAVTVSDLDTASTPASGSLPALVSAVLGEYNPRTQTVTTYLYDGSTVTAVEPVPGIAGLDWYWIGGLFLFALVLWSFFRFLGVIFKHG